ncbi:helix-turn-helix domain-containing protein [Nocardia sp. NPDC003482]
MDQKHALRVAVKIVTAREAYDWSITELAKRSNVDKSALWRIEQGHALDIRPRTLRAISEALGMPPCDLYYAAGWMDKWELPPLKTYLHAKYSNLPLGARRKILKICEEIAEESGICIADIDLTRGRDKMVDELEENIRRDASNA